MKKILAIIGSPRKGDTFKAVKRFEEELNKKQQVQMEYIHLNQYGLSDCTGCHNCIKKGQEYCHEGNKIKELQDKMLKSDGIILATPVYNQHVTSLMKKFMDYYTFLWHRPEMFGMKFIGISSGGGMFKPVFSYLKMNVENWGATWVDGLGVPHYEALTDKYRGKLDCDIEKKAKLFLQAMEVELLPKPSIGKLLWFNIWKMNAVAGKDDLVKDFEHWSKTNWLHQDYYYETKVGIFKKTAVTLIVWLARSFMRKVYKGY